MVLTEEGRRRLSLLARSRERWPSGRFKPMGYKYEYSMNYVRSGSIRGTMRNLKWMHVRISQYSRQRIRMNRFRWLADRNKPSGYAIPNGNREKFEDFQELYYSMKQAKLEEIDNEEPIIEEHMGAGGGLRDT